MQWVCFAACAGIASSDLGKEQSVWSDYSVDRTAPPTCLCHLALAAVSFCGRLSLVTRVQVEEWLVSALRNRVRSAPKQAKMQEWQSRVLAELQA